MPGQKPRQELSRVRVIYADGDKIKVDLADFDGTDVSSWEFECDVYDGQTLVTTFSSSGGQFVVTGAENDILQLDLTSSDTSDLAGADSPTQEGIVKAVGVSSLNVDPWRFMRLRFFKEIYINEE